MRNSFIHSTLVFTGLALAALGSGCSNSDTASGSTGAGGGTGSGGGATSEETVDLLSWWVAPGEVDALQALIAEYKKVYPNGHVINSGEMTSEGARAKLDADISTTPPDVFQINAQDVSNFEAQHPGSVTALDDIFADPALKAALIPDVLHQVTVGDHVTAMPVGIYRENALFYNKQIFTDHALSPPTTIAELIDACKTLKAAGVTPIATSHEGWIVRVLFNEIVQGTMGVEMYNDFITGAKPVTQPAITAALKEAIATLSDILTNYVNSDAGNANFGWSDAADAVHVGKAAMFLHGDWAKGYFVQLGWTPGVDFGQVGAPGASDLFWYGIDTFEMPKLAAHPAAAHDFLSVVASKAGQVAFNRLKGSTPMRADARELLDPLGQTALDDLVNAKHRIPVVSKQLWDDGLGTFAMDGDQDALYQMYVMNPP